MLAALPQFLVGVGMDRHTPWGVPCGRHTPWGVVSLMVLGSLWLSMSVPNLPHSLGSWRWSPTIAAVRSHQRFPVRSLSSGASFVCSSSVACFESLLRAPTSLASPSL